MPTDPEDSVPDRGKVITEEELDLTRHENVAELDDGRFLVSTGRSVDGVVDDRDAAGPDPEERESVEDEADADLTEADVTRWLEDHFDALDAQYGFHATAKFDDGTASHRMVSNDVVTSFESLLLWYAQRVGGGTPVEDVLGILLAESSVSVNYPVATLVGLLDRYDLDSEDSVGALIDAVAEEDAVTLSGE